MAKRKPDRNPASFKIQYPMKNHYKDGVKFSQFKAICKDFI
jgi:hypothetical protein